MASPAAVLAIVVQANTRDAERGIRRVADDLKKVDHKSAMAKLGFDVDEGGYRVSSALVEKFDKKRGTATLNFDADTSGLMKMKAAEAVLTKESSKLSDVFNRSQLSIGQQSVALAALLPVVVDLAGALGALTASAAAATAGLAALGVGGAGAATVGLAGIAAIAVPAVAALKDLKTAQDAYTLAVQQYGKHSTQARTAFSKLRVEQKKAGPEATKFAGSLREVTRRWKDLTKAGQSNFFGALNDGLDKLNRKLPLLAKSANSSMKALRVGFNAFLSRATGPEFNHFIEVMTRTFAKSMGPLGTALGNVAKVLQRIAVAVAPDIVRMAKGLRDMTQGWVDSTRNAGKLREVIHGMVNQANTWWKLIKAAGELIVAVLVPGAGQGKRAIQGITDQLKEWTRWVNQHPKEMRNFFKEGLETTKQLAQVLLGFLPMLMQVSTAMRPIARAFLAVAKALNSIKIGNVSALTVLLGAFVAAKFVRGAAALVGTLGLVTKAYEALRTAAFGAAAAETAASRVPPPIPAAFGKTGMGRDIAALGGGGVAAEGGIAGAGSAATAAAPAFAILGAAVLGAGAAFEAFKHNWLGISDFMKGTVIKPFAKAWRDLSRSITKTVDAITGGHAEEVFRGLGHAFKFVGKWIVPVVKFLGKLMVVSAIVIAIAPLIIITKGLTLVMRVLSKVLQATAGAFRWMGRAARNSFGVVLDAGKRAFGWIRDVWSKVGGLLKDAFRGLGGFIRGAFAPVKDAIKWVVDKVKWLTDHIPDIPSPPTPGKHHLGPVPLPFAEGGTVPGYASGGRVRSGRRQKPSATDTVPAMLTPGEFVVQRKAVKRVGLKTLEDLNQGKRRKGFARGGSVGISLSTQQQKGGLALEGSMGKKVLEASKKVAKATAKVITEELGKGTKSAAKDTEEFVKKHGKNMDTMRDTSRKTTESFRKKTSDDFDKTNQAASTTSDRLKRNVTDSMQKAKQNATKASGSTRKGVADDFQSMAGAVGDALKKVEKMTNKALKTLGVKPVHFGVVAGKKGGGGKQQGGIVHRATGGMVVPGHGTGDKVHLEAMVEPGEVVHVLNKNASKQLGMLEGMNQRIPRFQLGGVQPATAALAHTFTSKFGGFISSGLRPGDPGFHGRGMAFDWVGGDWDAASKYANQIGPQLLEGIHQAPPGQNVSWDSGNQVSPSFWGGETWARHVSHIHIAVGKAIKGAVGAAVKKLERTMLEGARGPMLDIGQASVDKVTAAANKLIEKKAAKVSDSGTILHGSGDVEKAFAEVAKRLSTSKKATLALGEAGFAESGMRDLAGGDSTSQGALQLLSTTASSLGVSPHDEKAVASLFLLKGFYGRGGANKLAETNLPAHLVAQNVQGSADSSGSNYAAQEGAAKGWMQRFGLKQGGVVAPFIGKFQEGGPVERTGFGLLHQGEHVLPKMQAGGQINLPRQHFAPLGNIRQILRFLGFDPKAYGPKGPKGDFGRTLTRIFNRAGGGPKAVQMVIKALAKNPHSVKFTRQEEKRMNHLERVRRGITRDQRQTLHHLRRQHLARRIHHLEDRGHLRPSQRRTLRRLRGRQRELRRLERLAPGLTRAQGRQFRHLRHQQRHGGLDHAERRHLHRLQAMRRGRLTHREAHQLHRFHREQRSAEKEERFRKEARDRLALEKELIEEFKVLSGDLKIHNKLVRDVRTNETAALRAVTNLFASQIGAQGLQKKRQASAGSVARY